MLKRGLVAGAIDTDIMFTNRFDLFTILGFRVSLDPTWVILAILVTWSLATGYFPQAVEGLPNATAWWLGAAGALGLFLSIILHEFAHAWVARQFDLPIKGITLFIFGGVAEMEDEPPSAKSEFYMAIAGPITSYVLAAVFFGLAIATPGALVPAVFGYLALINTVLATFNLIPAFPLDGGRVFRAAFWWWTNDYAKATRIAAALGRGFGIVLILLGVLNLVSGSAVSGVWLALIGLFLIAAASSSVARMALQTELEGLTVSDLMVHDPVKIDAETPLDIVIENYFYQYHHTTFPVVRDGALLGCIRIEDVGRVPPADRMRKTAGDIVSTESRIAKVPPDMPALEALKAMQNNKSSRLIVAEDGVLKGVLTMRDIMSHLSIRQELEKGSDGPREIAATHG